MKPYYSHYPKTKLTNIEEISIPKRLCNNSQINLTISLSPKSRQLRC